MGSLTTAVDPAAAEGWSAEAVVYVNGVRRVLPDGLAHLTLLQYLRDIGLTGTKLGCGEGGCGACTVMVSHYDQTVKKSMHYAINACLAPLYSVEGMHIITVEGLGSCQRGLHPVQGVPNPKAIHSSKAVGEPPFFLASAVLFAIKDAILAARAEEGYHDWFPLDNPATPERIRMACIDAFTKPFAGPDYHPKISI